jgi:hypothetical protein
MGYLWSSARDATGDNAQRAARRGISAANAEAWQTLPAGKGLRAQTKQRARRQA